MPTSTQPTIRAPPAYAAGGAATRHEPARGVIPNHQQRPHPHARTGSDAHKRQHGVERRFSDAKSGLEIAPFLLKNPGRIHALLIIDFLALLVSALIERELRQVMTRNEVPSLPLYPEARPISRPTGSLILKLYADITRHAITHHGTLLHAYPVTCTDTQRQVLKLLDIPKSATPTPDTRTRPAETPAHIDPTNVGTRVEPHDSGVSCGHVLRGLVDYLVPTRLVSPDAAAS